MRSLSAFVVLSLFVFNPNPCLAQEDQQDTVSTTARHGWSSAQVFVTQQQERVNTTRSELESLQETLTWLRGHRDRRTQLPATRAGLTACVPVLEARETELQAELERQQAFLGWATAAHGDFGRIEQAAQRADARRVSGELASRLSRQVEWIDARQAAIQATLATHQFFTSPSGGVPNWVQAEATRLRAEHEQLEQLEQQLLPLRDDARRLVELTGE